MTAHHTGVSQKPMHSKPVDWVIYSYCAVAQYLKQSTVMCGCVSQTLVTPRPESARCTDHLRILSFW